MVNTAFKKRVSNFLSAETLNEGKYSTGRVKCLLKIETAGSTSRIVNLLVLVFLHWIKLSNEG